MDIATVYEKIKEKMIQRHLAGMDKLQEGRLTGFLNNLNRDALVEGLKAYGDDMINVNIANMTSG